MDLSATLAQLEAYGTAQNRNVYPRHGVGPNLYGVSYANLGKLKKTIRQDHALALALWDTGNHDARVLATMIADPRQATPALLEAWADDLDNYVLTDAVTKLAFRTAFAEAMMRDWMEAADEWRGRAGWSLLSHLANKDTKHDDAYYRAFLPTIEARIHGAPNKTRDAMNSALMAIGLRNESLAEEAIATARRIGPVEVDHGATACVTPAAEPYIRKGLARKRRT